MYVSKYQPEYYKPYKPQNNSGCCHCGGRTPQQEATPKKIVRRYCYIRYDGGQQPIPPTSS